MEEVCIAISIRHIVFPWLFSSTLWSRLIIWSYLHTRCLIICRKHKIEQNQSPGVSFCPVLIHFDPFVDPGWLLERKMGARWKGKDCEAKALADPMSDIVSQLQRCFGESDVQGRLAGCNVILAVGADGAELLGRACFGRPVVNCEKDKQWFQLGLEEALFLCFDLGCLKIVGQDGCVKTDEEVWRYVLSVKTEFLGLYKGYSHLRKKNWVVRPGSQYGVDFVAYRHHPSLVHSEYAVLVLWEGEGDENGRLRVWSDVHCTTRLCGSVAKTLLVLYINKNDHGAASPSSLESYPIEERTITRWSADQNREE